MKYTRRPVFVTGVPRCGSSWVGEVLSTARRVRYNYEPFNPFGHPYLTREYVYLTAADDDPAMGRAAENAFAGRVRLHQFLRGVKWGYAWRTVRPVDRVIVKDPTAFFMAEWVAKRFDAQVLVILRHPCAFASSLHRLGWSADVSGFLDQPRLVEDWLGPYVDLLRECQPSFWRRVGAFWGAAHAVLCGQLKRNPSWRFVQYEDLCRDPRAGFERLFDQFELEETRATRRMLVRSTTSHSNHPKSTRRDSRSMVEIWRDRLTDEQIETVMSVVRRFDLPYYQD